MTNTSVDLIEAARQLCAARGLEHVWRYAVTHPSASKTSSERSAHEALITLGKAGLPLVAAWYYVRTLPAPDVAAVTARLSAFDALPAWVVALATDDALSAAVLGGGLCRETLPLSVREAISTAALGACFLADTAEAASTVLRIFAPYFRQSTTQVLVANPKSELQSLSQATYRGVPQYQVVSTSGPDHQKEFVVAVSIPGTRLREQGRGTTKKAAEKSAAECMLRRFNVAVRQAAPRSATSSQAPPDATRWSSRQWIGGDYSESRNDGRGRRFIDFFFRTIGIDLPLPLAMICLKHCSAKKGGDKLPAMTDVGLPVLGNLAFRYAVVRSALRSATLEGQNCDGLCEGVYAILYTLGTNTYKQRLSRPWTQYVEANLGGAGKVPPSVVLEAFEASLGAVAVLDLGHVDQLAPYIERTTRQDVDWDEARVASHLENADFVSMKSRLQALCQRFARDAFQAEFHASFRFEVIGPAHCCTIACAVDGDHAQYFRCEAPTKRAANELTCRKILARICESAIDESHGKSGVKWIDATVESLRDGLITNPSYASWLTPFAKYPFPMQEFWQAVAAAVRSPNWDSVDTAVREISRNDALQAPQRSALSEFVVGHFRGRKELLAFNTVESALNELLEYPRADAAASAVRLICSCLHLLRILQPASSARVRVAEVVQRLLELDSSRGDESMEVPEQVVDVATDLLMPILQQLYVSDCVRNHVQLRCDSGRALVVVCELAEKAFADAATVLRFTWRSVNEAGAGFSVEERDGRVEIEVPIVSAVMVNKNGVWRSEARAIRGREIPTELEAVRSALHDVKNRIIATPATWGDEIQYCSSGLRKAANAVRVPQLERVELRCLGGVVEAAISASAAAYGGNPELTLVRDDGWVFADAAMVSSVIQNVTDNAARAARGFDGAGWGVEGLITVEELEITIWNRCADVPAAESSINSGRASAVIRTSTGVGVETARRLASKMLGELSYEFRPGEVRARVVIPLSLEKVSWALDLQKG